jgi:hypothetical protein
MPRTCLVDKMVLFSGVSNILYLNVKLAPLTHDTLTFFHIHILKPFNMSLCGACREKLFPTTKQALEKLCKPKKQ